MTESQSPATLTCLKCGGAMRTYERSGVVIDQCTECRGVFLDRGELDRIVDAESPRDRAASAENTDRRPADEVRRPSGERHSRDDDDDDDRRRGRYDDDDRRRDGDDDDRRRDGRSDGASRPPSSQPRKKGGLFGNVIDILGGGE